MLSGRNSHASPPRRLESLKPTLPHHVGTRDGGPSWKNPAFPFPDGPKKGDPIWSRGTTKVDGMKRLGGAFGTCFSGKEGPLFPPFSSGPKSVCHLRPSGGGDRSSAAAFRDFSTRLLPLYRPQSTVKTTRPCLFFCFREEGVARFLPLHSLVPRSRLNPRRRRRHPLPSLGQFSRPPIPSPVLSHYIRYNTGCLLVVPGAWVLPASLVEVDLSMQHTHSIDCLGPWGIQGSCGL